MEKIRLPSLEAIFVNKETPPNQFDETYKFLIQEKKYYEGYMLLTAADKTYYLFISDGYPFTAGQYDRSGFKTIQIRDFFSGYLQQRPHIVSFFRTDEILTKSMVVLFQQVPTMQVTTDLIDMEEILQKLKEKGVDTVLAIKDQDLFSLVLCQQGIPSSCYFVDPGEAMKEDSPTDQMLVYIYNRSSQRNVTIDVYQSIIISKAPDSCSPPENYSKTIPDFYTRPQPDLHVMLGEQSITKYRMKGNVVRVGRVPENDIVINNLGVSRKHCEIVEEGGRYYLVDLGAVNGTFVNGQKIERALLNDKDEVLIGKHKIIFNHSQQAVNGGLKNAIQDSQTVMMDPESVRKMRDSIALGPAKIVLPDGQIFELTKTKTVIGNSSSADIRINDKTIAPEQFQILRDQLGYKLVHISNVAMTFVNNKMVPSMANLENDCEIKVGNTFLKYHAPKQQG